MVCAYLLSLFLDKLTGEYVILKMSWDFLAQDSLAQLVVIRLLIISQNNFAQVVNIRQLKSISINICEIRDWNFKEIVQLDGILYPFFFFFLG